MSSTAPRRAVSDAYAVEWAADRAALDRSLGDLAGRHAVDLGVLGDAVRYSLLGGGKRIRGLLLLAAYRTAGGRGDAASLAAAVEVVHAYSLVHDDLPCMDDDDMRRGRSTVHRVYGVPLATAAGVAMVPLAVAAALDGARELRLDDDTCARLLAALMRASGAGGMIGGQLLDLEGEGRSVTLRDLERIHSAKTGALIGVSAVLGAVAAGATPPQLAAFEAFGSAIGLAFQIADDVLDVTGTTVDLGKPAGRDVDLRKGTYPALLGIDAARERAAALVAEGCETLRRAGLLTDEMSALARFVVERRR
jgi:geranylgeranyl pyrophosphate synthase